MCLAAVLLFSCRSGKEKYIIPEKNLVSLLSDMYIGDGLLQYPPVRNMFSGKDTSSSYNDIIMKHGYTRDMLDRTLKYYFVNDPKELQKIYDEVLARLSEIQSQLTTGKAVKKSDNLWNKFTSIKLPSDAVDNSIHFNIPIADTGTYTLSFSAIIFGNDQTLNPRAAVFFQKIDSVGDLKKTMWPVCKLIKDNSIHSYSITARIADHNCRMIGGSLFEHDSREGSWTMNVRFDDISLQKAVR